jgi:hypothetical protein
MFDWTSFGTGFAKAGSEKLDKDEEDAKALGAAQVKSLYENYASVVKENRTLSNDIKEKINVIKGFAPNASDDQLVALAQDRGVLDMLSTRLKEKDFDPTGFDINNFVKVTNTSESKLSAEDRINQLFTIPSAVDSASKAFTSLTPEPEKQGFLSKLMGGGKERQARAAAEQTALALGVPLEKLQGAVGYKRDIQPSGAVYDLSLLKSKKGFVEVKDATQLEMYEAKNLYDKDPKNPETIKKLADATKKVATLVAIEGMGKAEAKKTEEDIRTELTNTIVNPKSSPEEKKAARLELEQRQKLQSKDSAEAAIQTDLINKIQDPNTSPEDKEKARLALDERQKLQSKDSSEAAIQTALINKIQDPNTSSEDKQKARLALDERQKLQSKDSPEAAILTDLVNKILDPATPKAEVEKLKRDLDARQKLLAKDVSASQVTQANYITIASRAISSAVTEALPPGSLTTTVNPDGTVQMMPSDLVKGPRFTSAISAAKAGLITQFTKNGIPLSEFHKNALISVNIMPDAQGKFVASLAAAETPEPAAPAAAPAPATPLVPRPAAPAAAAAATSIRPAGVKFTREQEAIVAQAEAAIAQGANVDAIKKRLKDNKIPGF